MDSDPIHLVYYFSKAGCDEPDAVRQFELVVDLDFSQYDVATFGRVLGKALTCLGEKFNGKKLVVLFHCYTKTRIVAEDVQMLNDVQIVHFVVENMQPVIGREKVQFRMNIFTSDVDGKNLDLLLLNTAVVEHHRRQPEACAAFLSAYLTEDRRQAMTPGVVTLSRDRGDYVTDLTRKFDMAVFDALKKMGI